MSTPISSTPPAIRPTPPAIVAPPSAAPTTTPSRPATQDRYEAAPARGAAAQASPQPLPSKAEALALIREALPSVRESMERGGFDPNTTTCDKGAGKALAQLRAKGLDAQLSDSFAHVTLRVKTREGELIVDPTIRQFFKDGSPADQKLRDGFVGTRGELRELFRSNAGSIEPKSIGLLGGQGLDDHIAEQRQAMGTARTHAAVEERERDLGAFRAELEGTIADSLMRGFYTAKGQGPLWQSAELSYRLEQARMLR